MFSCNDLDGHYRFCALPCSVQNITKFGVDSPKLFSIDGIADLRVSQQGQIPDVRRWSVREVLFLLQENSKSVRLKEFLLLAPTLLTHRERREKEEGQCPGQSLWPCIPVRESHGGAWQDTRTFWGNRPISCRSSCSRHNDKRVAESSSPNAQTRNPNTNTHQSASSNLYEFAPSAARWSCTGVSFTRGANFG